MRLYLLPLSTRRTLLYAQRFHDTTAAKKQTYLEKGTDWAARLWSGWEKRESGWQRKVVDYGNHALRRIPYEEWALKTVPPLTRRIREAAMIADTKDGKVELVFPPSVIAASEAEGILAKLATERHALHKKRLTWCFVAMPVAIPFGLLPIIPNLPFYYLCYRAWSHWRAIAGGQHVKWLIDNKKLTSAPSKTLDLLYDTHGPSEVQGSKDEQLLLTRSRVQSFSKTLDIPALEIELERAIWQVEVALAPEGEKDAVARKVEQVVHDEKEKQ